MKKPKYKVGDRLIICGKTPAPHFIGKVIVVNSIYESAGNFYVKFEYEDSYSFSRNVRSFEESQFRILTKLEKVLK